MNWRTWWICCNKKRNQFWITFGRLWLLVKSSTSERMSPSADAFRMVLNALRKFVAFGKSITQWLLRIMNKWKLRVSTIRDHFISQNRHVKKAFQLNMTTLQRTFRLRLYLTFLQFDVSQARHIEVVGIVDTTCTHCAEGYYSVQYLRRPSLAVPYLST